MGDIELYAVQLNFDGTLFPTFFPTQEHTFPDFFLFTNLELTSSINLVEPLKIGLITII